MPSRQRERRLLRMLVASVADSALERATTLDRGRRAPLGPPPGPRRAGWSSWACSPIGSTTSSSPLAGRPDVPLQVHARYIAHRDPRRLRHRRHSSSVAPWQTGVYWAKRRPAPTSSPSPWTRPAASSRRRTRYRDYAISRDLIHWESQSVTRADSDDRPPLPGARPARHRRSCSSPASAPTTAPSGSSAPPPTCSHESEMPDGHHLAAARIPCRATSSQRSPPPWRERRRCEQLGTRVCRPALSGGRLRSQE